MCSRSEAPEQARHLPARPGACSRGRLWRVWSRCHTFCPWRCVVLGRQAVFCDGPGVNLSGLHGGADQLHTASPGGLRTDAERRFQRDQLDIEPALPAAGRCGESATSCDGTLVRCTSGDAVHGLQVSAILRASSPSPCLVVRGISETRNCPLRRPCSWPTGAWAGGQARRLRQSPAGWRPGDGRPRMSTRSWARQASITSGSTISTRNQEAFTRSAPCVGIARPYRRSPQLARHRR